MLYFIRLFKYLFGRTGSWLQQDLLSLVAACKLLVVARGI